MRRMPMYAVVLIVVIGIVDVAIIALTNRTLD